MPSLLPTCSASTAPLSNASTSGPFFLLLSFSPFLFLTTHADSSLLRRYPYTNVKEFILFSQLLTRWGEAGVYGFLGQLDSRPASQILLQSITTEARQQMSMRQMQGLPAVPEWFEVRRFLRSRLQRHLLILLNLASRRPVSPSPTLGPFSPSTSRAALPTTPASSGPGELFSLSSTFPSPSLPTVFFPSRLLPFPSTPPFITPRILYSHPSRAHIDVRFLHRFPDLNITNQPFALGGTPGINSNYTLTNGTGTVEFTWDEPGKVVGYDDLCTSFSPLSATSSTTTESFPCHRHHVEGRWFRQVRRLHLAT